MAKRNEIWIFVNGGCITEIRSTNPSLRVNLIDYDELERIGKEQDEYAKLEQLSEGMPVVF